MWDMSKNIYFDQLLGALSEQFGISEKELLEALFIIRAHYNLAAIVLVCQHIVKILNEYHDAVNDQVFDNIEHHLEVLKKIASIEDINEHFLNNKIKKNKIDDTPLRPFTGESGLCDLLLIIPKDPDVEHKQNFEWICTWFLQQTIYFQKQVSNINEYETYITGANKTDGADKIKLNVRDGSRIYNAFLAIRQLGNYENKTELIEIKSILKGFTQKDVKNAKSIFESSRTKDVGVKNKIRYHLGLFLSRIWSNKGVVSREIHDRIIKNSRNKNKNLGLMRYGQVFSNLIRIDDEENLHTGLISEIYEDNSIKITSDLTTGKKDIYDDPLEVSLEPDVLLFLADRNDFSKAFYAAKSMMHHIEASHVTLPWEKSRLSNKAIAKVFEEIKYSESDEPMQHRVKLAIGLSLLSGRHIFDMSAPIFTENKNDQRLNKKVGIVTSSMLLSVPAGAPKLKSFVPSTHPLHKFGFPWSQTLCLPLPKSLYALVKKVETYSISMRQESIEREAKKFLSRIEQQYEITTRTIKSRLLLELYQQSKGDLGVVKAITDVSGLNYDNIIHYASYEKQELQALWRTSLVHLGIEIPDVSLGIESCPTVRVGSPHGIDQKKITDLILQIKDKFHSAVNERSWNKVLNILTIYTVIWLNLATAGRRSRNPFPRYIDESGWALITDKHRKDESTDRYVPLTQSLRKQIDILRRLMMALGYNDHDLYQAVSYNSYHLEPKIFNKSNKCNDFKPIYFQEVSILEDLPGNWGRKLVRSQLKLRGRLKDAGLGHWVSGRHPWCNTSPFASTEFQKEWLALQVTLESELTLEVLNFSDVLDQLAPKFTLQPKQKEKPPTKNQFSREQLLTLLKKSDYKDYLAVIKQKSPDAGLVALELGQKLLGELDKSKFSVTAVATSYCEYIRQEFRHPLFEQLPRKGFQKNWLVSEHAFSNWCYVEQQLLIHIVNDLKRLPAIDQENIAISIGRLIVVSTLYAGILSSGHLTSLFTFLASDSQIIGVGELRAIDLQVPCERSKSKTHRTLLLTPYVSTLFLLERERIKETLTQNLDRAKNNAYSTWNSHFQAYLKYLSISTKLTLSQWFDSIKQNLLLNSSPILAAYASGGVLSHDLSIAELQRLGEYEVDANIHEDFLNEFIDGGTSQIDDDILPNLIKKIKVLRKQKLTKFAVWEELFKNYHPHTGSVEKIIRDFGEYLLSKFRVSTETEDITVRMQQFIEDKLTIVYSGLSGFSNFENNLRLSDDHIVNLSVLTGSYFHNRKNQAAWNSFRKFLCKFTAYANGPINDKPESLVSAKVFTKSESIQIIKQMSSSSSGISLVQQHTAQRHFRLAAGIGARRAEVEYLRGVDIDEDMIRIRPYEQHTLKTIGSERVAPLAILEPNIQEALPALSALQNRRLIAIDNETVSGDNFFPKVSKLISKVTDDKDIGLHHLRHTLASSYALKTFANCVDLSQIDIDLPWLKTWLPSDHQFNVLIGTEGQVGQGLKAISRLLGHIHETTTLKHYIHSLFIALYTYYANQKQPELHLAFENRIMSRSWLYEQFKKIKDDNNCPQVQVRVMRKILEESLEKHAKQQNLPFLLRISKKKKEQAEHSESDKDNATEKILYFEEINKRLLFAKSEDIEIKPWITAFNQLALIKSGLVGCQEIRRHPLPVKAEFCNLPKRLNTGIQYQHARDLIHWLIQMKEKDAKSFEWLINKWIGHSEREKGLMNIGMEQNELNRLQQICEHLKVECSIQINQPKNGYFQIAKYSDNAEKTSRFSGAVRWVMTWMAVEVLYENLKNKG